MSRDILDDNLQRLIAAAPERDRLSREAKGRMKERLAAAWEPDRSALRTASGLRLVPRRAILTRVLAVAAGLLLIALGAARLVAPTEPAGGASAGSETPGATVADASDRDKPKLGPSAIEQARVGEDERSLASPGAAGGRSPGLRPDSGRSDASGTGDAGAAEGGSLEGATDRSSELVATVGIAMDAASVPLPTRLTLWVKPVVSLPQVADPTAHDLPVRFEPVEPTTSADAMSGRLAARITLPHALDAAYGTDSEKVLLQVEMAGMAPARALVSTEQATRGDLRFELAPGITVAGTVVDLTDGNPVPGALVVALDQLPLDGLAVGADPSQGRIPAPYTVTDALGRYTLRDVAEEPIVRLRASGGSFAPTMVSVATDGTGDRPVEQNIELGRGTTVNGIVERPDGTRWKGAAVVVSRAESDPTSDQRAPMTFGIDQCDANGEYTIAGIPAGNYVALVFRPDDRTVPVEFRQLRIKGSPQLRLDFVSGSHTDPDPSAGLTLSGVVVDASGSPLIGESLSISSLNGAMTPVTEWRVSSTDDAGRFQVPGIGASYYVVHRVIDGFERMTPIWEGRVDSSQDLRIVLADTQLRLAWRGEAEAGRSWTVLQRWRPRRAAWGFAGSAPSTEGAALRETRFDHLPPGRYRAVLMGPGHGATWTEPFEVEPGRPTTAATRLAPGAWLPIRLTDAVSGGPVAGATFRVRDADGRLLPQQEPVITDIEGQATQRSVPFGSVTVEVVGRDSTGKLSVDLDFTADSPRPLEFQLPQRSR